MKNDNIYVFGHKNPDTDSVCGAISLSYLKNKRGVNTIPVVLGEVNKETLFALDYFKVMEPSLLNDVKLQIKDVNYHRGCYVEKSCSIKETIDYINEHQLTGIPLVDSKRKYFGYISLKEISKEIINGDYHHINTSYENLLKVLKGKEILHFNKNIEGNVLTAGYSKESFVNNVFLKPSSILIVGDRGIVIKHALESKVKLIVLVSNFSLQEDMLSLSKKNKVNIISTPLSSYEVSKLISLANFVKDAARIENSVTFNEFDYLSDFNDKSKKLKHTNYPITNNKNECLGMLTLTDCNEVIKKKVILVDHNNFSQSVEGLDEAEIMEVIDHHNIGDINTLKPINFRNSSSGSVNTIIYDLYKEMRVKIPTDIAGLMASAIISDTLLLTSPTTTEKDCMALKELSKIAKINYKKYGMSLLKAGMTIKGLKNKDLLHKDFKSYKVNGSLLGIGQVLTTDIDYLKKKKDSIVDYLNEVSLKEKYLILTIFVTDIFEKKSYVLYNAEAEELVKESFKLNDIYETIALDNILSRKSQIAPYLMDSIEKNS